MIEIAGFMPDAHPNSDGVLLNVENLIPTLNGMASVKVGTPVTAVVPQPALDIRSFALLDGTSRTIAFCASKIYDYLAGAWVDVTGGTISTPDVEQWSSCQYGNVTIATNNSNYIQQSTTSGVFSNLTTVLDSAEIVETVAGFVMAFNYKYAGDRVSNGFWTSALFNHTDWQPNISTQASNGMLLDTAGKITAAKRLGASVVVYKAKSFYHGEYVGGETIWTWNLISSAVGAFGQGAVVQVDAMHYFLGNDGFYVYDGARPTQLGTKELKQWVLKRIDKTNAKKIKSLYDLKTSVIYWYIPSIEGGGVLDEAIVFNTVSGKFGRVKRTIAGVTDFNTPSLTWGELGLKYPTWVWPSDVEWFDDSFGSNPVGHSVVVNNRLVSLDGGSAYLNSSFETSDFGDDSRYSTLKRVRVKYLTKPTMAHLTCLVKNGEADPLVSFAESDLVDARFDFLAWARFHRLRVEMTGALEISSIEPQYAGYFSA